jgi:hypothetical protein
MRFFSRPTVAGSSCFSLVVETILRCDQFCFWLTDKATGSNGINAVSLGDILGVIETGYDDLFSMCGRYKPNSGFLFMLMIMRGRPESVPVRSRSGDMRRAHGLSHHWIIVGALISMGQQQSLQQFCSSLISYCYG